MYLSKLEVDFETAGKLYLTDLYRWHQHSWDLFPGRNHEKRQFLTRLDPVAPGFRFYTLSAIEPVCPKWVPRESFQVKKIHESFLSYTLYRFDLRANPTKKIKSFNEKGEEKKNGKRIALLKEEDLLQWLNRKAEANGFEVIQNPKPEIEPPVQNAFFKDKSFRGSHFGAVFKGILKVKDPALFKKAFLEGIGSAKSFGFGMLLLQPVK
ncbi:MAG TPA: type I-E CRISPR-associated protein Cas6/Cse3/CasE [Spirochaetia bacterium]|nr:type I-E CRISPR-associated protein Cas6/Cse3/CasE [Spirochaetia bacterium]